MSSRVWGTAQAYETNKSGSLVVVILKEIRQAEKIKIGAKFIVKTDAGNIIYSPINSGGV
jgi:hypothetical protein